MVCRIRANDRLCRTHEWTTGLRSDDRHKAETAEINEMAQQQAFDSLATTQQIAAVDAQEGVYKCMTPWHMECDT